METCATPEQAGVGHTVSGRRWLRAYRDDQADHGRGGWAGWLTVACALAATGLVILLVADR